MMEVVRFTVASMAPICLAVLAKAPAKTKIQIIRSTFLLPAPSEKVATRRSRLPPPWLMLMAYIAAMINAETTGTL